MRIYTTLFIALLLLVSTGSAISKPAGKAPDFTLKNLDGESVSLQSLLANGPVVLDFWATWCKPCVQSLPKMQRLYEKYKKNGVQFVAINEDGARNRSLVRPFLRSKGLTFPVLLDDNSEILRKYRLTGIPATILISTDGTIVKLHTGYRPGDERILDQEIAALASKIDNAK